MDFVTIQREVHIQLYISMWRNLFSTLDLFSYNFVERGDALI